MKRKNWRRLFCIFMVLLLLFQTGCGKTKTGGNSKEEVENSSVNKGENTAGNDTEGNVIGDGNETLDSSETETVVYGGGEYSDIIYDRKVIKGQFAVYFFRGDTSYESYSWTGKGGDSVFLIAPDGTTLMYDCGTPLNAPYIAYALQELGIEKIDYFVNSHPHIDHLGGFSIIARHFKIGHVYMPPAPEAYDKVEAQGGYVAMFMRTIKQYNIPYSYLAEGDTFMFGSNISVKVYNPPANLNFDTKVIDANEWSLALKFVYKNSSVLLSGDCGNNAVKLGRATESELAAKYGSELQADVSKMNHHGDAFANGNTKAGSKEWLNAVKSKIYVGMAADFRDEKQWYIYLATGAKAFHTSIDGTVLVYTAGDGKYEVQTERDRYTDYFGKTNATNGHMIVK